MEKETILNLMVIQHALIEALFSAFKDEFKENPERAKSFLSEFVWEAKKHFFIEEEAIFNSSPHNAEILETISRLKYEHVLMRDEMGKMLEDLSKVGENEIEGFLRLLTKHRETEERKLYPLLDEKLSEKQKNQVISRVNEVPLKEAR